MVKEFKLPDIGEGVHEGEITKWMVAEGTMIKEYDPMVEVMTDKVTVQIPSPFGGKVLRILAKEGEKVKVGTTIIVIGDEGEAPPSPAPVQKASEEKPDVLAPSPAQPEVGAQGMVIATPAVRRLARDLGVDINLVRGTGPRNRVTEDDVRQFSAKGSSVTTTTAEAPLKEIEKAPPTVPQPPSAEMSKDREERVPLRGVRKRTSEKMHKSKTTAAHFALVEEVDMTSLVHLRERLMDMAESKKVKLTYLPFVIKALTAALKEYPDMNASMDDDKAEIVLKKYYNVGIATATEQGLIVPIIKDADKKDVWELASEIDRLATEARAGKLKLEDVQGGTITITSLGAHSGVMSIPVINWPEAAIISINKIEKRPIVINEQIVIRHMMFLSLSFDHRILDGHVAAAFANMMVKYLEHPTLLFLGSG